MPELPFRPKKIIATLQKSTYKTTRQPVAATAAVEQAVAVQSNGMF